MSKSHEEGKQSWAEAVIECVSDSAERERLIRMYDYDELVKACLALGTLALTAKTEYQRAEKAEAELRAMRSESADSSDAAKWREHCKIMKEASRPDALHMRLTLHEKGQVWDIEYVLDVDRFKRGLIGTKAVGLAAERKAEELFEAIAAAPSVPKDAA